ncbi:hypothetical protein PPERSA_03352 [Pseudocohnilembus persalinus]|uniref:BRO1 domain-containing protein n=1 Tax=Pseudocohnilembus persalinus TaxID=266149 RepID=A0A0V0R1E6_PSEPJ|nr:hypothetical protein PPERSA_03352 [Pseudocohnilembus persalinus]|eukprot:KRX08358.1 hypothetical protein PPERSA_03352 [Pseudocohnilembus persalinus]
MLYFFDIPQIKDSEDLTKLIQENQIAPEKYMKVKQAQSSRQEFKNMMNMDKILNLINLQDGLVNYTPFMEQYLSVNVDMLEYLGYNKSSKQPNFQYETFISNSHTKYETKNIEKPEAYAGELLMARYMYAFAYSMDAFKYLKKIKYFSEQNMTHEQKHYEYMNDYLQKQKKEEVDLYNKDVEKALENLKIGYTKIFKVYNVINDLLFFLVQKQQKLIPELKATTLYSIKLLFETNANGIYIEKLITEAYQAKKPLPIFQQIANMAKTQIQKLNEVNHRFEEIKSEVKSEIFEYLNIAIPFYKGVAATALSKCNDYNMQAENYGEGKNHTIMAGQQNILGKTIVSLNQAIQQQKPCQDLKHLQQYALLYFQKVFLPTASRLNQVYEGMDKKSPYLPNFDQQITELSHFDYFKDVSPLKKINVLSQFYQKKYIYTIIIMFLNQQMLNIQFFFPQKKQI